MRTIFRFSIVIISSIFFGCGSPQKNDTSNVIDLSQRREETLKHLQDEFLSWKFGMFIHFNMGTSVRKGWTTGKEDPLLFNPRELDCEQWADAAVSAKMKYGILTVKHTGGWCLWNSEYTDHDMGMFKKYEDGEGDIVREFVDAFRSKDLKVGLYYCFPLWDSKWADFRTLPFEGYEKGNGEALTFVKNQFKELLSNYGKIDLIWIDQNESIHGGLKDGDWLLFKSYIHSLQPNCIVIGNETRNYEKSDIYGYEYPYSQDLPPYDNTFASEVCDKLQEGWFSLAPNGSDADPVRDVDYIVNRMLRPLNQRRTNYLLNCAPNDRGLMPQSVVELLKNVGLEQEKDIQINKRKDYLLAEIPNDKNMIALVVEDNSSTKKLEDIMSILNRDRISSTFFLSGKSISEDNSLIKQLDENGHEIGIRVPNKESMSNSEARILSDSIKKMRTAINSMIDKKVTAITASEIAEYKRLWDILNYFELPGFSHTIMVDYMEDQPNANSYVDSLVSKVQSGSIILLNRQTANLQIIDKLALELKEKGFQLVTVSELAKNASDSKVQKLFTEKESNIVTGAE